MVGVAVRMGVRVPAALLQPAAEARGVGVDAVQRLELLPLGLVRPVEVAGEAIGQRVGDVSVLPPGGLGDLGPPPQRLLGLLEDGLRAGTRP